jgi:hypothetical protein
MLQLSSLLLLFFEMLELPDIVAVISRGLHGSNFVFFEGGPELNMGLASEEE